MTFRSCFYVKLLKRLSHAGFCTVIYLNRSLSFGTLSFTASKRHCVCSCDRPFHRDQTEISCILYQEVDRNLALKCHRQSRGIVLARKCPAEPYFPERAWQHTNYFDYIVEDTLLWRITVSYSGIKNTSFFYILTWYRRWKEVTNAKRPSISGEERNWRTVTAKQRRRSLCYNWTHVLSLTEA